MVGRKLRICQSNGKWTPNIPVCIRKYLIFLIITEMKILIVDVASYI